MWHKRENLFWREFRVIKELEGGACFGPAIACRVDAGLWVCCQSLYQNFAAFVPSLLFQMTPIELTGNRLVRLSSIAPN